MCNSSVKNKTKKLLIVTKYKKESQITVEFHFPTVTITLINLSPYKIYKGIERLAINLLV